jgi:hypothetical protein
MPPRFPFNNDLTSSVNAPWDLKCRMKPQGGDILKIMALGQSSQNPAPQFGNILHLWALLIIKPKVKVIMNLDKSRWQEVGGGGFLHLLIKSGRDLTPTLRWEGSIPLLLVSIRSVPLLRSRHKISPLFYKERS